MANETAKKKSRFAKGLVAGAAIGAAAAVLLTPKTGKEAQKIVKQAIKKARSEGEKILKVGMQAVHTGEKAVKNGRKIAEKAAPKVKKTISDLKIAAGKFKREL